MEGAGTRLESDAVLRQENAAVLRCYLAAWSGPDVEAIGDTLHHEIDFELGFVAPGVPERITGKASVMTFLRAVPSTIGPMNFHEVSISTLEDPAELVAEYRGQTVALATDRPYRNRYITRARVENGKIRRFAEFSNPLIFMDAFGSEAG
jgi:ketosteroid isomerase-like protein